MSKRRRLTAKKLAVLGGTGLALGLSVARASAVPPPPPFTVSNYVGRYVCNVNSDGRFYTAIMRLRPNGAGAYNGGTLVASISAFTAFDPAAPPEDNSCSYSLVTQASRYVVSSNGLATEVLTWKAAAGNNAACPDSPGSFVMSNAIVLQASLGAFPRVSVSSGNLLDQGILSANPGDGYCA